MIQIMQLLTQWLQITMNLDKAKIKKCTNETDKMYQEKIGLHKMY